MLKKTFATITCGALLLAHPVWASCAKPEEAKALSLRTLTSHLMVAALSCGQQKAYNQFMHQYQPLMQENGPKIKAYFKRAYGRDFEARLNQFITNLANQASESSMSGDMQGFCQEAAETFAELNQQDVASIQHFAIRHYTATHGIQKCSES